MAGSTRFDVIPAIFGVIHIPEEVQRELSVNPGVPGAFELQRVDWLKIAPVRNPLAVEMLRNTTNVRPPAHVL